MNVIVEICQSDFLKIIRIEKFIQFDNLRNVFMIRQGVDFQRLK